VKDLVISLAKQLEHLGQSSGLESVDDSEMESPAYQTEEVRHLAVGVRVSLAWLADELLQLSGSSFCRKCN
jgi:hypothetical protein